VFHRIDFPRLYYWEDLWSSSPFRNSIFAILPAKWSYFHLYVILDVLSRMVVGWLVADRERSDLARELIKESRLRQGIRPEQLTLHADHGSSMKSKPVAHLLTDLG